MLLVTLIMGHGGHLEENKSQERKHQSLDEADKDFQSQKGDRGEVGQQKTDHDQQHFTRENITEETEVEGDDLGHFGDQFEDADEAADRVFPGRHEEFSRVRQHAKRGDAERLRRDHGNQRNRQRHIDVGVHRTKDRQWYQMAVMHPFNRNAADAGQNAHPIGEDQENQDRGHEGEKLARHIAVLHHAVKEIEEPFNNHFHKRLKSPRYLAVAGAPKTSGDK